MMAIVRFVKMSGAGNDFIAVDNMDGKLREEGRRELFARWCARGTGVGADGVILAEPTSVAGAHFRMRYYNADGGEAATCGNGSRCLARFAFDAGIALAVMRFETQAGIYEAQVLSDGRLSVDMSDAVGFRDAAVVPGAGAVGFSAEVYFVNTGVPHAVVLVDDVNAVDVENVGRFLRFHEMFGAAGANVNFAQVAGKRKILVRTYERGVEGETLACGTGSVACAIVAQRAGLVASPVQIVTRSGEVLEANFTPTTNGAEHVRLTGPAEPVFRGEISYPKL